MFCSSSSAVVGNDKCFFFKVLLGNVVTCARCGWKHDKDFIANSLLNPKVKEF